MRDVVASGKCHRMKSGYRFAANQQFDTFAGKYVYKYKYKYIWIYIYILTIFNFNIRKQLNTWCTSLVSCTIMHHPQVMGFVSVSNQPVPICHDGTTSLHSTGPVKCCMAQVLQSQMEQPGLARWVFSWIWQNYAFVSSQIHSNSWKKQVTSTNNYPLVN